MTSDREELREKVVKLYADKWGVTDAWLADAAIAVCLEEAARVVEADPDAGMATRADWTKTIGGRIAAAIRGLKG
jgi:hypothetical protein